jgi:ribosomal protein S17
MNASRLLVYGMLVLSIGCNVQKDKVAPKSACPVPAAKNMAANFEASGVIVETMNAATYTYARIYTGTDTVWAAAPQFEAKIGDSVVFSRTMPMQNYTSKTLNKTFSVVYFNGQIPKKSAAGCCAPGAPMKAGCGMGNAMQGQTANAHTTRADTVNYTNIKKVVGAKTVAELFAQKDALVGKKVILCGKIVKANYNIMSKTWLHVRDGSGSAGSNDVTVTTPGNPKAGDIVVVQGTLNKDKNLGYGYVFPLIIEDATVEIQK